MIQPIDDSWLGNGINPKVPPASGIPWTPQPPTGLPPKQNIWAPVGDSSFLWDFSGLKKRTAKSSDTSAIQGNQISTLPPSSVVGNTQPSNPLPSQTGAANQAQMQNYQTDAFDVAGSNAITGTKNDGYQGLSMIDRQTLDAGPWVTADSQARYLQANKNLQQNYSVNALKAGNLAKGVGDITKIYEDSQQLDNAYNINKQQLKNSFTDAYNKNTYSLQDINQKVGMVGTQFGLGRSDAATFGVQEEQRRGAEIISNLTRDFDLNDRELLNTYTYQANQYASQAREVIRQNVQTGLADYMRNMGMGRLNNTTALSRAANGIKDILANAQLTNEQYSQQMKILNDGMDQTLKIHMASKEVDTTLSQNLGYVTNKFGQPVLDAQGNTTPYKVQQTDDQKARLRADGLNALISAGYSYEEASSMVNNASNGMWSTSTGSAKPTVYGNGTTDIRSMASKFPNVAAFKNNNTAGLTWNNNFENNAGSAKLLTDAGIQFSKGTARPGNEGGNYVSFNSIEDGLAAQRIIMEGTYGNSTVSNFLKSWVGTSEGSNYAKQVAGMAGITDLNAKVSDISKEQLDALQIAKIKKESGGDKGLYKVLVDAGIIDGNSINFAQQEAISGEKALETANTTGQESPVSSFMRDLQAKNYTTTSGEGEAVTSSSSTGWTPTQDNLYLNPSVLKDFKTLRRSGGSIEEYNRYVNDPVNQMISSVLSSDAIKAAVSQSDMALIRAPLAKLARTGTSENDLATFALTKVKDTDKLPLATTLSNIALKNNVDPKSILNIGKLINNGDKIGAVQNTEQTALERVKKNLGKEYRPDAYFAQRRDAINELVGLIAQNTDKFGIIDGTIEDILIKAYDDRWSDSVNMKAKITSLFAKLRNEISGANITEGENKFLEPMIPSSADQSLVAIEKLQALSDNIYSQVKAQRDSAGLPVVKPQDINNYKKITNYYK